MVSTVLITGFNNRITVNYPDEIAEEVEADFIECIKQQEIWIPGDYESTTAYQEDAQLFMINMGVVTGVSK